MLNKLHGQLSVTKVITHLYRVTSDAQLIELILYRFIVNWSVIQHIHKHGVEWVNDKALE